jgi:glyoxylase-like metal-dependent hydrolase (beta-lactamase superfamily II)
MKLLFILPIVLFLDPPLVYSPQVQTHFTLIPVADGTWAAIHKNPGGHAICNAGIIDLGDKTVVIDPFMNLDAAEELKAAAIQLTGREPGIIINTHHHNDHIRGNQLFPSASIVSTEWTRQEIARAEPKELQWEKENAAAILASYKKQIPVAKGLAKKELPLWIDYFEGMVKSGPQIKTTLPTMTFRDSLWIHGTKRSIQLAEFENGHTKSDLAVFLPAEGIVFTGDLLFKDAHPWLSDGNPLQLKKYLDAWAGSSEWKVFIPGHGAVGDRSTVQSMSQYISDLQRIVLEQKIKGVPDSVIEATPLPEAYAEWMFGSRFYAANLNYFCRQIK